MVFAAGMISDQDWQAARSLGSRHLRVDQSPAAVAIPADDDATLLALIAQHDETAFRRLVERHLDRAYAIALRMLRNPADAEDVTQDVLLKVWANPQVWQSGKAKFTTWLYRVITNRCIDLRRRPATQEIDEAPEMADAKPDAEAAMHQGQVNDLLERAMGQLPDQQRIALILSYTDGMSNPEIAEIMETTISAVESLQKRGRQQLRHFLRKAEPAIRESFIDL